MRMYTSQVIRHQLKPSDRPHRNGYPHKVVAIIMTVLADCTPFPHPLLAMNHPSPSRASSSSTTRPVRCPRRPPSLPRLYLPLVSHMMHIRRARTFKRWLQLKRSRRDCMMHMLGMWDNLRLYYTSYYTVHSCIFALLTLLYSCTCSWLSGLGKKLHLFEHQLTE